MMAEWNASTHRKTQDGVEREDILLEVTTPAIEDASIVASSWQ